MNELDEAVAFCMAQVMRPAIRRLGYKPAREQAIATYLFEDSSEEEIEVYRRFLDRYFNERAVASIKLKHRPRPPLHAYEGGTE
jgi:hypothetical protein